MAPIPAPQPVVQFSPLDLIPLLCVSIACIWSAQLIRHHLSHYTHPLTQRCIVRIVFLVPVYAITSFFELLIPGWHLTFATIRSFYEGFALYQFFSFFVTLLGGESATILAMGRPGQEVFKWPPPISWWSPPLQLSAFSRPSSPTEPSISARIGRNNSNIGSQTGGNAAPRVSPIDMTPLAPSASASASYFGTAGLVTVGSGTGGIAFPAPAEEAETAARDPGYALASRFFWQLKSGILQFILVTPATATVSLILSHFGVLHFPLVRQLGSVFTPHTLLVIVDNVSICCALYCLVCFLVVLQPVLRPYSPVAKFVCLKGVLFASYWQFVGLALLGWLGLLPTSLGKPSHVQAWLICCEMVIAGWGQGLAFNYEELYLLAPDAPIIRKPLLGGVRDMVSPRDVVRDIRTTFIPSRPRSIPDLEADEDPDHIA